MADDDAGEPLPEVAEPAAVAAAAGAAALRLEQHVERLGDISIGESFARHLIWLLRRAETMLAPLGKADPHGLRKLAEKATRGRWVAVPSDGAIAAQVFPADPNGPAICDLWSENPNRDADAAWIAATCPDVLLPLLDAHEARTAELLAANNREVEARRADQREAARLRELLNRLVEAPSPVSERAGKE